MLFSRLSKCMCLGSYARRNRLFHSSRFSGFSMLFLSYSYTSVHLLFCGKKHPLTCEFLPNVRMHFALSKKKHLGFPCFLEKVNSFRMVKIKDTLRYLCGSHECDEYLMTSHSYLHSNAFFLFQSKHPLSTSRQTYLPGCTPGKMHWSEC